MGTWTLHADFKAIDGGKTQTMSVHIATNVDLAGPGSIVYEPGFVSVEDGVLNAPLPANDVDPYTFGFIVTRTRYDRDVDTWEVPTQPPDTTRELNEFTNTTGLPVPDLSLLLSGRDPRFPEGTVLPLKAEWQPQWVVFIQRDPITNAVVDEWDEESLPA